MTFNTWGLYMILSINNTKHNYNDECHFLLIVMLNIIIKCHYAEYRYNKSRGAMI